MIKTDSIKKFRTLLLILTVILAVAVFAVVLSLRNHKNYVPFAAATPKLDLKPNAKDAGLTDVYLRDTDSGVDAFFLTVPDVYRDSYHPAEFVSGNLYVIRRIGTRSDGSLTPNWTDELWKYDAFGNGLKLYSAKAIDFRVSYETDEVAALIGSFPNESVALFDSEGKNLKSFRRSDLRLSDSSYALAPLYWRGGHFWLSATQGQLLKELISVDASDLVVVGTDVSGLNIAGSEFAIDPSSKILAYSTYISPLDVKDVNNPPLQSDTLYLYDLLTGAKKTLLTVSVVRGFYPAWLDSSMLEYNDPNGLGRVKMRIGR